MLRIPVRQREPPHPCSSPQLSRICTALYQPQNVLHYARMILAIGYAEPRVTGTQHLYAPESCLDKCIDCTWNITFSLEIVSIPLQEALKLFVQLAEYLGRESPHVHADDLST